MIIFGSTSLNSTIDAGTFHCPRCSMPRGYRHIGVNRWFTIYFIPLIPLGRRGDYIECDQCTGTFGPEVLNYRPEQDSHPGESQKGKLWQDLRRCLVVLLNQAQRTDPSTLAKLKSWYESQSQQPITMELIAQELRQAADARAQIESFARQTFGTLAEDGKLFALQSGRMLLDRGGRVEQRERDLLRQFGNGLSIPGPLVETTIA